MSEEVDWMWCYENPHEAAAEIARLRAENAALRAACDCGEPAGIGLGERGG